LLVAANIVMARWVKPVITLKVKHLGELGDDVAIASTTAVLECYAVVRPS
jgi:hypothetical protein